VAAPAGGLEPLERAIASGGGHSAARPWAEAHAADIVGFLQELVRHEAPAESQRVVDGFLRGLGANVETLVPGESDRPVVLGSVPGRGGGGRSLVLNGHVDVVGAGDPALWSRPPFAAEIAGGRIFGRGTADAKGPLAALLFGLACALELSGGLRGDVTVAAVADEEVAGPGTQAAIAASPSPEAAVVGEPTRLAVAPASRGAVTFRLEVEGREAHAGSSFLGVNAIEKAALYVDMLVRLQAALDDERPHPLYEALPVTHAVNVATIRGGESPGVVPRACVLEAVVGCVAGESAAEAKGWIEEAVAATTRSDRWLREHPPQLDWLLEFEPGATALDHPFVAAALAAGTRALGEMPQLLPFLGGSDLRHFTVAGIPAVHVGPGDLLEAHGYDESVDAAEVVAAAAVVSELVCGWCG
jgi:acetylornithine deacetylase